MKRNIFLASYPKSGNTWLRAIISNLLIQHKDFSLDDLKLIQLLSSKKHFKKFKNIPYDEEGYINFDWISENNIESQKILNKNNIVHKFYKVHSVRHKKFTNETVNLGKSERIKVIIALDEFSASS